jgi:hypothetical protein
MVVVFNHIEEFLERCNFQIRLIAMPFHIRAFPEHFPMLLAPVVSRLGNGVFEYPAFVLSMRTEVEYLDALSTDAECKVNLSAEMWRRPPVLDEFSDQLFAVLQFKFGERHG